MQARRQIPVLLLALILAVGAQSNPVAAKSDFGWDARITARAISAKRVQEERDDVDNSGLGLYGEIGVNYRLEHTIIRLEVDASIFDYAESGEDNRVSYAVKAQIDQPIAKDVDLTVDVRHSENIATLEAGEADQQSVRAELTFSPGKERIEIHAAYRWRDYEDTAASTGKGLQFGARYRHSFKSYHWVSIGAQHDAITSDNSRRGYQRTSLSVDYSHPLSRKLRVVAGFDLRKWEYDERRVGGNANAKLRKDSSVRPEIGLSYGRSKGVFARGTVGYDWRMSNDERYDGEGFRADVRVGFRF